MLQEERSVEWLRYVAIGASVIAGGVGVGLLAGFLLTREEAFAVWGFLWIMMGGLLTAAAFVCGVLYAFGAWRRSFRGKHSRLRACVAVLLPVLNLPLAVVCASIGSNEYASTDFAITNAMAEAMSRVAIESPDGQVTELGPLAPGERHERRFIVHGEGQVRLIVEATGVTREGVIIGYTTGGASNPPVRVRVDDLEMWLESETGEETAAQLDP